MARGFVTRKNLTINCTDHSRYFAGYKIKTTGKSLFKAICFSQGGKRIQGITRDFIYIIRLKTRFHFLFVFSDIATIIQIVTQLCLSKTLGVCPHYRCLDLFVAEQRHPTAKQDFEVFRAHSLPK